MEGKEWRWNKRSVEPFHAPAIATGAHKATRACTVVSQVLPFLFSYRSSPHSRLPETTPRRSHTTHEWARNSQLGAASYLCAQPPEACIDATTARQYKINCYAVPHLLSSQCIGAVVRSADDRSSRSAEAGEPRRCVVCWLCCGHSEIDCKGSGDTR